MGIKTCKPLHDMSCLTQTKWSLCFSLSSSDLGVTVIVAGNSALISGVILKEKEVLRSDLISLVGQAEAWRLFWFVFSGQQHHIRVCVSDSSEVSVGKQMPVRMSLKRLDHLRVTQHQPEEISLILWGLTPPSYQRSHSRSADYGSLIKEEWS